MLFGHIELLSGIAVEISFVRYGTRGMNGSTPIPDTGTIYVPCTTSLSYSETCICI